MIEISREDSIKVMNTWRFICSLVDNVEPRPINVTRQEMVDTCNKAISDMRKLEQIEQIVKSEKACRGVNCNDCDCFSFKNCLDVYKFCEIKQILKE